jgi:hypothetical protein
MNQRTLLGSEEAIANENAQCSVVFKRRPSSSQRCLEVHSFRRVSRGLDPFDGLDVMLRLLYSFNELNNVLNGDPILCWEEVMIPPTQHRGRI